MIPAVESSPTVSDEPYFLTYSITVSRMNSWQLTEELAKKVDDFDLLNDDLGRFKATRGDSNVEEAEKKIASVVRQIEILRKRMR
ncbi:MAG: hypothetical protein ACYCPW_01505 [Nitrososphaerales archaeon]